MDKQTKEALKQIQAEMRALQAQLAERAPDPAEAVPKAKPPAGAGPDDTGGGGTLVRYSVRRAAAGDGDTAFKTGQVSVTDARLAGATDEAAAQLGYALSSPQKVGLLRALLGRDSESAADLGATAGLSTGSLYHHLRDLMHAGLLAQAGRSRYAITARGQRVLLVLLALTLDPEE